MAKSFVIRFATKEETSQVERLWAYSFHHDSEAFCHWYFHDYYRHKECLVAIGADGDIYATLQLIESHLEKNGKNLKGAYIVGVAVSPEARDEKLAKALMLYAENYAKQEGFDFLLLMPFEAGFYYPFGYTFVDYHHLLNLSMTELTKVKKEGKYQKVDLENPPLDLLLELYLKSQEVYLIKFLRNQRHLNALVKDTLIEGGHGYIYWRNEKPVGYLFYTLTDCFNVRELVYLDEEAKEALYHFILSHASQVGQLKWSAALIEPLSYERKVDKSSVCLYPFMMAKLIKLSSWIPPYPNGIIYFNLKDNKKEVRTYRLDASGLTEWEKLDKVAFELSETALTKLAFGRHQIEKILPNEVNQMSDWQAFKSLFEKGLVYFNEYF